jgi:hypothetical protein
MPPLLATAPPHGGGPSGPPPPPCSVTHPAASLLQAIAPQRPSEPSGVAGPFAAAALVPGPLLPCAHPANGITQPWPLPPAAAQPSRITTHHSPLCTEATTYHSAMGASGPSRTVLVASTATPKASLVPSAHLAAPPLARPQAVCAAVAPGVLLLPIPLGAPAATVVHAVAGPAPTALSTDERNLGVDA